MPKNGKMGRNPLERLNRHPGKDSPGDTSNEALSAATSLLKEPPRGLLPFPFSSLQASLEKVREMQIEVNWEELCRSTLGQPIQKLLKNFIN